MSDLIDRQAAIEGLKKIPDLTVYAYCSFLDMLMNMPSAQPEITMENIEDYCKKRCLCIVTDEFLFKLMSQQPERGWRWNMTPEWIVESETLGDLVDGLWKRRRSWRGRSDQQTGGD